MHKQPWPVAPRPFTDEAFGSWLGRVASRYRIGVDELLHAADIDLAPPDGAWLAARAPQGRSLERLAALCRMTPAELTCIGAAASETRTTFPYCFGCLVLNPLDATAPYWKAHWIETAAPGCSRHPQRDVFVTVETLRRERNMRQLCRYISRRQRGYRAHQARMLPFPGSFGARRSDSVVRGLG